MYITMAYNNQIEIGNIPCVPIYESTVTANRNIYHNDTAQQISPIPLTSMPNKEPALPPRQTNVTIVTTGPGRKSRYSRGKWFCVFFLLCPTTVLACVVAGITISDKLNQSSFEDKLNAVQNHVDELDKTSNDMLSRLPLSSCFGVTGYRFAETRIYPPGVSEGITVQCDISDGGGWMVIQSRDSGDVSFDRTLAEYINGFGNLSSDYWIGLEVLHNLTKNNEYELKIELSDWCWNYTFAHYKSFKVGPASEYADGYKLFVAGYDGTAYNSLASSNDRPFTISKNVYGCPRQNYGGWWFGNEGLSGSCSESNLNGKYYTGEYLYNTYFSYYSNWCKYSTENRVSTREGIFWNGFDYGHGVLKRTIMKIRLIPREIM